MNRRLVENALKAGNAGSISNRSGVLRSSRAALCALVIGVTLGIGCASEESRAPSPETAALDLTVGCQPLLGGPARGEASTLGRCLLPYPSDFYRVADASTATGARVVVPESVRPKAVSGGSADPNEFRVHDGFSLLPTIVAAMRGEVLSEGLSGILDDPAKSATADSATIILEADSGALVPHYVDVDPKNNDDDHRAVNLRPHVALKPRTHYVVGMRRVKSASDPSGLVPPAEGFRRLRDKADPRDPALATLAARYDKDVFDPLTRVGIPRGDLQLAWDFTTGSTEEPVRDMLRVRELTLAWLAANTPEVSVTSVDPAGDRVWKFVNAKVQVPLFLESPAVGAKLFRGADGQIVQNGTTSVDVLVQVPETVRDGFDPGRAVALGHGFFGARTELSGNGGRTIGSTLAAVMFSVDWWGMSKDDLGFVADTITAAPGKLGDFTDRLHQAMANWIVTTSAVRGAFTKLPELHRPSSGQGVTEKDGKSNAGELLYDPSSVHYFGASLGHILGGVLAALDPDFARVVLNVGGAGLTQLMPRAQPFAAFSLVVNLALPDPVVAQAYYAMVARSLDRIDPGSYANMVLAERLPGSPDRRVLMQAGLGDALVPNIGTFFHARMLGLKLTQPTPSPVFGLTAAAPEETGSSLTLFDFGVDVSQYARPVPPESNAVHEGVRINKGALEEMDRFFRDGVIAHPCDGMCDPD